MIPDSRNLILLCTTQGIALQQDGRGKKKNISPRCGFRKQDTPLLVEAERSKHKVGGEQKESKEEREDAIIRGKATSSVIGIKAATRFNVLMTIQIPLAQKKKPKDTRGELLCSMMACDDSAMDMSFGSEDECCEYPSTKVCSAIVIVKYELFENCQQNQLVGEQKFAKKEEGHHNSHW